MLREGDFAPLVLLVELRRAGRAAVRFSLSDDSDAAGEETDAGVPAVRGGPEAPGDPEYKSSSSSSMPCAGEALRRILAMMLLMVRWNWRHGECGLG